MRYELVALDTVLRLDIVVRLAKVSAEVMDVGSPRALWHAGAYCEDFLRALGAFVGSSGQHVHHLDDGLYHEGLEDLWDAVG